MTRPAPTFAIVTTIGLLASAASAQVVTFGQSSIDPLESAGTVTEGFFEYYVEEGAGWEVQTAVSVEGAALATFLSNEVSVLNDVIIFQAIDGSDFYFSSVDYRTGAGGGTNDNVDFDAYLDGEPVAALGLSAPTLDFTTVNSGFAATPIDEVRIRVSLKGTNALYLDNIVVRSAAVPEPGSVALAGLGIAGLGLRRRRRTVAACRTR